MSKQTEAMKLALKALEHLQPTALTSFYTIGDRDKAITALREELAKPDFWEGYVPEPVKPATEESSATQAQQEPVAFFDWYDNAHWGNEDFKEGCHRSWNAAIKYTNPPAAQRQWVGTVDCIGLALDLEVQAKRVESQTIERAMLAAANGLRIIDKESKT